MRMARRGWCVAGIVGACLLPRSATAAEGPPTEARVKAAFVFNFARFVEWPRGAFADRREPFIVGVLGRTPLTEAIEESLPGKSLHGRSLVVRRFASPQDVAPPVHVLVIDDGGHVLDALPGASASEPLLTIGNSTGFCRRGGIIGFFLDDGKIRFEVNVAAAERRGLRLSSSLLRLARIVGAETQS